MLMEDKDLLSGQKGPTLLCVHPHGIFCLGWGIMFAREETKDVHFCFSSALYQSPFFRVLSMLIGKPSPVDKDTISNLMKKKANLALIPGGFEEASLFVKGTDVIYLKHRKGFVKYALQYGYSLTPVYVFGERDTFWNLPGFWKFRLFLNRFGIPAVVPVGQWWCPILPRPSNLHIVVGEALPLPHIPSPSPSDVDQYHHLYIQSLTRLYNKHFPTYHPSQTPNLQIW
uniref:diacylglycerol O-acyltransferase n=1 Tax=Arcella intermedia TaxID=1963864 RepID=A0A6B2LGP4_9EUKA